MTERREHKFDCPDGELDEVFIPNAFVHIERMDDTAFWIGIEGAGLPMLHLNTGVHRGVWFFNIEEDKAEAGRFLTVRRPRKGPSVPTKKHADHAAEVERLEAENKRLKDALKLAQPILDEQLQSLCDSYCLPCEVGDTFDYSELKEPELGWITKTEAALDAVDAALAGGGEGAARAYRLECALRALVDKLAIVLPIADSYIALQTARSGTQYDGPQIVEELAAAKALLPDGAALAGGKGAGQC